ncbi:MAG: lysoplasmalogenase [Leptospira sp.]|nr:lysoplasmalogenase [Leptospira sp.]
MPFYIILIIASVSLFALLLSEYKKFFPGKAVAKTITALSFVAFGYLQGIESQYKIIIFSGLVLGFLGDVFLIPANKKSFLVGLVAFLLAHVFYGFAFMHFFRYDLQWLIIVTLPVILGIAFYMWIYNRLDNFKIPVAAYLIVIHFMLLTAIAFYLSERSTQSLVALVGATLFYFSDFAVARERFVQKSFWNKAWGLPFYFVGQFLIAYSMSFN